MMKILIVDDNMMMRKTLRMNFPSSNYLFEECEDGIDALNTYSQFQPDIVLMDVQMKKMDGISATKNIRREYPDAKVIIVTDFDDDSMRQAAADAGALGYVTKEDLHTLQQFIKN